MDPTDRFRCRRRASNCSIEDLSPLNNENNPPLPCRFRGRPQLHGRGQQLWPSGNYACWLVLDSGAAAATYKDQWRTLCSVTITDNNGGIFPLQVKSSNIPGKTDAGDGTNQFSIKASIASGTVTPHVYALSTMSVFTNPRGTDCSGSASTSAESSFYLAEIPANNRGKRLTISLFDPGDGPEGTYILDIVGPDNAGLSGSNVTDVRAPARRSANWSPSCSYGARGNRSDDRQSLQHHDS